MIERIKELSTELRVHILADLRILHHREVKVIDGRSDDGRAAGGAEADGRLALKAFRLEEAIQRLFAARQVRVAGQIGPRVVGSAGEDVAIELHCHGQAGLERVDPIHGPAACKFL